VEKGDKILKLNASSARNADTEKTEVEALLCEVC